MFTRQPFNLFDLDARRLEVCQIPRDTTLIAGENEEFGTT